MGDDEDPERLGQETIALGEISATGHSPLSSSELVGSMCDDVVDDREGDWDPGLERPLVDALTDDAVEGCWP